MRYQDIAIEKDLKTGVRYYKSVKYPDIPFSDDDIYIESVWGDRVDNLAYDYYNSVDDYWIIVVANGLKGDSIFIPPGTQIRIPANLESIKNDFEALNSR